MRVLSRLLAILVFLMAYWNGYTQKTYILIPKKTGKINKAVVAGLSPALKALATFYSALGGTNCIELQCELTTALGLGNQGSDAQKKIIQTYFPDDKVAKLVTGQDCYLPPSNSISFSNFKSLGFTVNGENIQVNYELDIIDHGVTKKINGPDIYILKNQVFKSKKRVLYAWAEK